MTYLELLKTTLTGECYSESFWLRMRPDTIPITNRLKKWFARQMIATLEAKGYQVVLPCRPTPQCRERRRLGKDHPMVAMTMVGRMRLDNFEKLIRAAVSANVAGAIVECGVWRGGAAILAKAVLDELGANREVWLCDSFAGLPAPVMAQDQGYDFTPQNDYLGVSVEQVRENMSQLVKLDDSVHFLKGFFKDTLPTAPIQQIAVLRLDGDLYESTIQALDGLYSKVSPGGFVIIDDYGVLEPCRQAVHDFLATKGLSPEIHDIDGIGVYWQVT